jgi:hypothetical protein
MLERDINDMTSILILRLADLISYLRAEPAVAQSDVG